MIIIKLEPKFRFGLRKFYPFGVKHGNTEIKCVDIGFLRVHFVKEGRFNFVTSSYVRSLGEIGEWHDQVRMAERKATSKSRAEWKKIHGNRMECLENDLRKIHRENIDLGCKIRTLTDAIEIVNSRKESGDD